MANKKSKLSFEPPGPEELGGYKRGDVVYCFRWPDELLSEGTIKWFHEKTEGGPAFTFMCSVTGSYRISLMTGIIDNPTKKQQSKVNGAIIRKIKKDNQKPKTKR
jgi:hypothetical protein